MNFTYGNTLSLVPADILDPICTSSWLDKDPFYLSPSRIVVYDTGPLDQKGLDALEGVTFHTELLLAIEAYNKQKGTKAWI